jgi:regulator of replication initiation timing
MLQAEVKNSLDAAESRIVEENVKSFSQARHELKKDIHALREENAALKAEIKNIRNLGGIVNDLQKAVVGSQRKADEAVSSVEQISAGVSSEMEKQFLKMSKDMAGISAGMKAEMKDMLAKEKERFASQSAGLEAKYSDMAAKAEDLSGKTAGNYQTSTANRKNISQLDKKTGNLMKEIVRLKKEYRIEMGKLLKELEG